MFRSSLIVAGAALLCSTAAAQHQIDPSRLHAVKAQPKQVAVDVHTGKRISQSTGVAKSMSQIVYNNTCTWAGGGFYGGLEDCEDSYDGGRIPSTSSPSAPCGAEDVNDITGFQIAYCTYVGAANPDIEVAFWDNLNGDCVGLAAPTPPPWTTTSGNADAYFNLAGILPGSTSVGFQACWIVNLFNFSFPLASDGDGTFDNSGALDKFTWGIRHNDPNGASPNGFLISGEPASGVGACSYTIACGTDAVFGNTCGSGLDQFDGFWINADGVGLGVTTSGLCPGGVAPFGGTGCYFFGGYPTNPWAGWWLTMTSDGRCISGPTIYCTSLANSCGTPTIGGPSASTTVSGAGVNSYDITCGPVQGGNPSVLLYGKNTPIAPFLAANGYGWVCVAPFNRVPFTTSNGFSITQTPLPPPGCGGTHTYHWGNLLLANLAGTMTEPGYPDPALIPTGSGGTLTAAGQVVNIQAWYRDGNMNPPRFSNALTHTVFP
jgi:hypothetical protein